MATIPVGAAHTIAAPRAARRRYRVLREAPVIPLVILGVLTSVAVLAPVLAPHGKLDPVAPTREQCLAKYSMPDCPYLDNVPPFWSHGGRFNSPPGAVFLVPDLLSRPLYGPRIPWLA